jgi:hypothetical protein
MVDGEKFEWIFWFLEKYGMLGNRKIKRDLESREGSLRQLEEIEKRNRKKI